MIKNPVRSAREKEIRANWISSEGKFVTDDFIAELLNSTAPKCLHDQLRQANYNTATGEGKRSETARPISQTTSKNKSTKTTVCEEIVKKYFPKALPFSLITKGITTFLEEKHFSPRQTLHAHCVCAGDNPMKYAREENCFLGQHISLGGIAGMPIVESCKVTAQRATMYGCKMVVTYQSHCSVSANGTFDYVELSDKGTDLRIETQCCQPAIAELNKVIFTQQQQAENKVRATDDPPRPTVSVKMSAPSLLPEPSSAENKIIRDILMKHQLRLRHTADPPLIELPHIMYEEIRESLLLAMVPLTDIPTIFIGAIHIHTPPEIPDYVHVINVDLLRSRAVRNRDSQSKATVDADAGGEGKHESVPTPRSVYSDSDDDSDDEKNDETKFAAGEQEGNEKLQQSDVLNELDQSLLKQFYSSISKRIIQHEASKIGTAGAKEGVETASDRRQKRKQQKEEAKNKEEGKRNDDWNLKEGSSTTAAKHKLSKWFIYFRWSRVVRRMVEEVKRSEIASDWNLDDDDGIDRGGSGNASERKQKKKLGKFFLTLRWNYLVKRALHVHSRKERREDLHFY